MNHGGSWENGAEPTRQVGNMPLVDTQKVNYAVLRDFCWIPEDMILDDSAFKRKENVPAWNDQKECAMV